VPARRLIALLVAGAVAALAAPASAAADRWVDEDAAGNVAPCSQAAPCKDLDFVETVVNSGETIFIDGGTYPDQVDVILADVALQGGEFSGAIDPPATIDPGIGTTAVLIFATGAEVAGLNIAGGGAGGFSGLSTSSPVSVHDNVFEVGPGTGTGVALNSGSAGSTIADNLFNGPAPYDFTNAPLGIRVDDGPTSISGNSFVNTQTGIAVTGGTGVAIAGNEFSGHYTTTTGGAGLAVDMSGGSSTVSGNLVQAPATGKFGYAFRASDFFAVTAATISRNTVSGQDIGILAADATVNADSNLVVDAKPGGAAAMAQDTVSVAGGATLNITNLTTDAGIRIEDAGHVNLDSSIVGEPFDLGVAETGTCTITFSRGPTTTPGGNGCLNFQTTADPLYAGASDFRLTSASTLIDAGNPAPPAAGTLDLEGKPRALPRSFVCPVAPARRDIGAYEFGTAGTCPSQLKPPAKKKKCKKKKKGKKRSATVAAKKCKKRKR
jgi:hypothetical protein